MNAQKNETGKHTGKKDQIQGPSWSSVASSQRQAPAQSTDSSRREMMTFEAPARTRTSTTDDTFQPPTQPRAMVGSHTFSRTWQSETERQRGDFERQQANLARLGLGASPALPTNLPDYIEHKSGLNADMRAEMSQRIENREEQGRAAQTRPDRGVPQQHYQPPDRLREVAARDARSPVLGLETSAWGLAAVSATGPPQGQQQQQQQQQRRAQEDSRGEGWPTRQEFQEHGRNVRREGPGGGGGHLPPPK